MQCLLSFLHKFFDKNACVQLSYIFRHHIKMTKREKDDVSMMIKIAKVQENGGHKNNKVRI